MKKTGIIILVMVILALVVVGIGSQFAIVATQLTAAQKDSIMNMYNSNGFLCAEGSYLVDPSDGGSIKYTQCHSEYNTNTGTGYYQILCDHYEWTDCGAYVDVGNPVYCYYQGTCTANLDGDCIVGKQFNDVTGNSCNQWKVFVDKCSVPPSPSKSDCDALKSDMKSGENDCTTSLINSCYDKVESTPTTSTTTTTKATTTTTGTSPTTSTTATTATTSTTTTTLADTCTDLTSYYEGCLTCEKPYQFIEQGECKSSVGNWIRWVLTSIGDWFKKIFSAV